MRAMGQLWRWALLWLAFILLCPVARADTPVTLFQSFAGNVNFTGTQVTMRTNGFCDAHQPNRTLSKALSGIPTGAQILSAHLYWAGSGASPDYQVRFEGRRVTATRQYTARYSNAGQNYNYFSGALDVTATVAAKRNGTYSFSELTISRGNPWCAVQGVLGGFSLLVVYSHPSQPFRVLNIYEGFQHVRYGSISLNLSNFKVPDPLGSGTGRIGHVTWEGDLSLDQQGEDLKFNGTIMTDSMNSSGNQFNSRSNINNDNASYGIDFDAYTVSSPIIQAGQTTATTVYSSGQDMVLLNAEIVAVPNVSVADLQVSMTRSGDPFAGQTVTYTLTARNNGPNQETGPITVTNTLPNGMTFSSASGTGWTCSHANGKVTCTAPGPLNSGQALQPITIRANPPGGGAYTEYTNTAVIAGQLFDNVGGNNTAVDTVTDPGLSGAAYVLTEGRCEAGVPITDAASPCRRYIGPYVAGESIQLYVTALENDVPQYLHRNNSRTRDMRFSLSCVNPVRDAGVRASFAGVMLPLCLQNGANPTTGSTWSGTVTLTFAGGQASSGPHTFLYADVGRVMLNLIENNQIVSARFVSHPESLQLAVTRQNGDVNPQGVDGFVKAGEPFSVGIKVLMKNGAHPPNFGKETTPISVTLGQDVEPAVEGSFGPLANGAYTGLFAYHEAGNMTLTARLRTGNDDDANHYLGVPVPAGSQPVGRFYPAYFKTETKTPFGCHAAMLCPVGDAATGEALEPGGAAYSEQPFEVTVTAFGMTKPEPLTRYVVGAANQIRLSAVTHPGPAGVAMPVGTALQGQTTISSEPLTATPNFKLAVKYSAATPSPSKPATIYLRAESTETRHNRPAETISSRRAHPAISLEDGVQVVSGRLLVGNGAGSEMVKLPIKLTAQFYTADSTWNPNSNDNSSDIPLSIVTPKNPFFTDCTGTLASAAAAPNNCSDAVALAPDTPASLTLVEGGARFWLKAPGTGRHGNATIRMNESGALWPRWLPSKDGRASFGGVYRSRVIYMREVY